MSELQRLVNLVPYLRSHPGTTVEAVAKEFNVTPQRVLDDLSVLQFVGLPGGYYGDLFEVDLHGAREYGDIFVANVDALGRPMRLQPLQAASLMAALQVVVELGGDDAAARSALAKLAAITRESGCRVDVEVDSGDAECCAKIREALTNGLAARIVYRTSERGVEREAIVEPVRLRTDAGYTYLDAWSRPRQAWRTYRLNRIVGVDVLNEAVSPREIPEDLDTWFVGVHRELTVVVTRAGRWCVDYYPTTAVKKQKRRWRITFPLVSTQWGAELLLRLGPAVLEVSDNDVRARAISLAQAALDLYGGTE